jgi:hypothetical protein
MAKRQEKQLRERLDKATQRLGQLQEALVETQTKGEDKLRLARERVEKRVNRTRKRVEQQARRVAAREAKLTELMAPKAPNGEVTSPAAAAEVLSHAVAEQQAAVPTSPDPGAAPEFEVPLVRESKPSDETPPDTAPQL